MLVEFACGTDPDMVSAKSCRRQTWEWSRMRCTWFSVTGARSRRQRRVLGSCWLGRATEGKWEANTNNAN